jgi:hypothetical protein
MSNRTEFFYFPVHGIGTIAGFVFASFFQDFLAYRWYLFYVGLWFKAILSHYFMHYTVCSIHFGRHASLWCLK